MDCVSCGRRNQPTTRFCAECGEVLRADAPRARRSRGGQRARKRRVRVHWVRVPPQPRPSVLTARLPASAAALAAERPERMMRRVDLMLAAVVGFAGLAAYVAYPYLKVGATADPASVRPVSEAFTVTAAPMPRIDVPVPHRLVDERPAPLVVPGTMAPADSPAARSLDAVPPRTASAPRPKAEPPRGSHAESSSVAASRSPYAMPTLFPVDAPPPAAPPTHVAAAVPHAAAHKDRLQQLNETMATCTHEGLFARVACEQRALLAYCDGQWGKNDRCPAGRTADYGN